MSGLRRSSFLALALAVIGLAFWVAPANAVSIELKDVAPDRVERQRKAAEGMLPLPGTPDLSRFDERLAEKGLKVGSPLFIRIFKVESQLEMWMQKDDRFVLFATYPICHWSGTIGPKVREGDKQAPEGFYTVTRRQLHLAGRWPRSLNLGFPNIFDKTLSRTGNYILIHGGCSSVGCYAMTNTVIEEVFRLTAGALASGQTYVPVHVFPFRMTDANMAAHASSEWAPFWTNLKEGYDAFERTRLPPRVSVCEGHYQVRDSAPEEVGAPSPLGWCGATAAALRNMDRWYAIARLRPSSWQGASLDRINTARAHLADLRQRLPHLATVPSKATMLAVAGDDPMAYGKLAAHVPPPRRWEQVARLESIPSSCSPKLASCRKHVAMLKQVAERRHDQRLAAARQRALHQEAAIRGAKAKNARTASRSR